MISVSVFLYVIIMSLGSCSSMVSGSRNPIWREGFNFVVDELPVEVVILFLFDSFANET